jgi:hypothetical protein
VVDCNDLTYNIGTVKFNHISREETKVAHALPRMGFIDRNYCNWDDEPLALC